MSEKDKPDENKVVSLFPGSSKGGAAFQDAVATLGAELPNHLELAEILAKIRKKQYDSYIQEGFTVQQAFELVIASIPR